MRLGPALETLRDLANSGESLFDLIFIDADKDSYTNYLETCLPLLGNNTLRGLDPPEDIGTTGYNEAVAHPPKMTTAIIPILHQHDLDGLTVSLKRTFGK